MIDNPDKCETCGRWLVKLRAFCRPCFRHVTWKGCPVHRMAPGGLTHVHDQRGAVVVELHDDGTVTSTI